VINKPVGFLSKFHRAVFQAKIGMRDENPHRDISLDPGRFSHGFEGREH